MKLKTITPFPVEYGRYSIETRGGAPTLVMHEAGTPVSAEILVLDDALSVEEARDMLWRRERGKVGTGEKYKDGTSQNSVLVKETESPTVGCLLYADFTDAGKIVKPSASELAKHAIESVAKAKSGKDGINYLLNAMASGITTPLTASYSEAILEFSGAGSLSETLDQLKSKASR